VKAPHEFEEHLASSVRAYLRAVERAGRPEQTDEQRAIGSALEYLLGARLAEESGWDRGAWVDGILPHSLVPLPGALGVELRGLAIWDGSNWEGRRAQWIEPFAATVRLAAEDEAKLEAYTLSFGSAAHGLGGIPYGGSYLKVRGWLSPDEWWFTCHGPGRGSR
jgi:hypothetical protein